MQYFIKVLFNNSDNRTLVVMYTDETENLVGPITMTAAEIPQKILTINLDTQLEIYRMDGVRNFNRDVILLIMTGSRMELLFNKLLEDFTLLYTETRIVWLLPNEPMPYINDYLIGLHKFKSWYNLVYLHFDDASQQLLVHHLQMFGTQSTAENPRDSRFLSEGVLFNTLFVQSVNNLNQSLFYIQIEPDVPSCVFANFKSSNDNNQKWVVGSEVSIAILIGRYLNASVSFTTEFNPDTRQKNITKEQLQQFALHMKPNFRADDAMMKEALPWVSSDNRSLYYQHKFQITQWLTYCTVST